MTETKNLAIILIQGFADWEYGLLAAATVEWFGGIKVTVLTPGGGGIRSMAGLRVEGDAAIETARADQFHAVAVIGSDGWAAGDGPDIAAFLSGIYNKGGIVGAICGGTVPLAKSGLLDGAAHTSNARQWLLETAGDYKGAQNYQDTPAAVSDDRIITAPGTAPDTFAAQMLEAMLPDKAEQVAQMRAMLAAEHRA